jgi:plasmid maintenance system killer protein
LKSGLPDRRTEDFFGGENIRQFSGFKKAAERKLVMLDSAVKRGDLGASPGNRLEKLSGQSRTTQCSDQRPVANLLYLERRRTP